MAQHASANAGFAHRLQADTPLPAWLHSALGLTSMYPFGGILIAPLVAGYLASLLSRFAARRQRRPGWVVGVCAISGAVLATWIATFQLDVFRPWSWSVVGGKVDLLWLLLMTGFLAGFVAIIPAAWVVDRHQKQYDKTH